MFRNKELRMEAILLCLITAAAAFLGFRFGTACGCLVLAACLGMGIFHFACTYARYRRLRSLSDSLEALLTFGRQLPIESYKEGELSVLSSQIQKIALHLAETADTLLADKRHLADSLADISHQLRTPLTAMNLTAALLSAPGLPDARRLELANELKTLLHRTEWLVESLLKLSKLDAGTVQLAKQTTPIGELIRKAAQPLGIPMELRRQQLHILCSGNLEADLTWTAEAIGNILKNCMEHTPIGGQVTVKSEETPLFSRIVIEDTGPGFDEKDLPHLFERFYKGANASETSYGIGLALARTVITAQNGTVRAANTPTGARFTILFYKQVI